MLGGGNFSTLLTLAALQEGKASAAGVPLPPTLDAHKSLPSTPTTPTSTGQYLKLNKIIHNIHLYINQ